MRTCGYPGGEKVDVGSLGGDPYVDTKVRRNVMPSSSVMG